jgi:hypothetical protein
LIDFFKDYFTKTYGIYLVRWLLSALIMLPVMMFLESILPLWANLIVGQIFGSIIFFKIDKWIFSDDEVEIDIKFKHHHCEDEHQSDDHFAPYKVEPSEPSVSERKL